MRKRQYAKQNFCFVFLLFFFFREKREKEKNHKSKINKNNNKQIWITKKGMSVRCVIACVRGADGADSASSPSAFYTDLSNHSNVLVLGTVCVCDVIVLCYVLSSCLFMILLHFLLLCFNHFVVVNYSKWEKNQLLRFFPSSFVTWNDDEEKKWNTNFQTKEE